MKNFGDVTSYIKKEYIFLIICLSLLVCGVSTGGLYWYGCIIPLFFITVCLVLQVKKIKLSAAVYIVVLLAVTVLSLFNTNGDFQTGLYEIEKIILFAAAVLLGTIIKKRETILYAIYIIVVVSAVYGILTYCGVFESGESILKEFGQLRLQSFYKYANTAACLLGIGCYVCLEIYSFSKKQIHLYSGTTILLAMYLTLSKAAIPLFLIVGLYYIHRKKEIAATYVNSNIITMLFVLPINLFAQHHQFFIAFCLVLACVYVSTNKKLIKNDDTAIKIWKYFLIAAVIGVVSLLIIKPSFFSTFSQRLTYMKDSLEPLCDRVILGNGPGSWQLMKYSFQSSGYNVLYMHNSFLQFLFENGLLFMMFLMAPIVKTLIECIRKKHDGFAVILLLLVLHSCVDFDLAFGTMLIVLGFITGNIGFESDKSEKECSLRIPVSIFTICILCLACIYMTAEYSLRSSFEKECTTENYDSALEKAYELERLCPRDSTLQVNIASLIERTAGESADVKNRIENACKLSPYDPMPYEAYINYNMTTDNIRELCLKYIGMRPRYEGTHQVVKVFINKAYKEKLIDKQYRNELLEEMGSLRYSLKVYDRDELLDRIMNQRKNKEKEAE